MRPSSDITVFPRNRHTPFFKLFEHYKYFFLFGPNDTAKKKFISLYKDTVGEKAVFWDKDVFIRSIGQEYEIVPAVFNQVAKTEREFLQTLISAYDPVILASTVGNTISARSRLLNSISKDMLDRNRRVAFMFDYLETDLDNCESIERQLMKEKQRKYNWPNEGEFKYYDRIIYVYESCDDIEVSLSQKDYEAIVSSVAILNRG